MKKLWFIMALLLPLVAQALPFVPTTDPNSGTTNWYYLKTEGIYIAGGNPYASCMATLLDNDTYKWCFVSDNNGHYMLFNKYYNKYLGHNGLLVTNSNPSDLVYYKELWGDAFYLWNYDSGSGMNLYLYYDEEMNDLLTFGTQGNETVGRFEVELATAGDPNPDPIWTRYDKNGVGYRFVSGGNAANNNEVAANLCDGNTSTKYLGLMQNCWVIIEADRPVNVEQYSIVTANDSRSQYNRALRSWKLEGSNDGGNWTKIDERNYFPMPFENQKEMEFKLNDSRQFKYFKFSSIAHNNAENNVLVQVGEVWINAENHNWQSYHPSTDYGCGIESQHVYQCATCYAFDTRFESPESSHNYQNGVCTTCGMKQDEVKLLYESQNLAPHYVKGTRGTRDYNEQWPSAPNGWNTANFNDNQWEDIPLPMASPQHSDGPFTSLQFNSFWFNEYNCYWLRRTFYLDEANPDATYTLRCVHDDNMVVYVNGQEVLNIEGWTATEEGCTWDNASETFELPASAFRAGENVLAIYIQQNWGGAYFDCSLTRQSDSMSVGDVDGNGEVNGNDLNTLINILLGKDNADNYDGRANVDGQGGVDGNDLNALINILLGK